MIAYAVGGFVGMGLVVLLVWVLAEKKAPTEPKPGKWGSAVETAATVYRKSDYGYGSHNRESAQVLQVVLRCPGSAPQIFASLDIKGKGAEEISEFIHAKKAEADSVAATLNVAMGKCE